MTDHLTQERLLRYMDGELSRSAMAETTEHVQSCWSCRVELEHLEKDIAIILDAHKTVFLPSLPNPPRPWVRIETRIQGSERSRANSNVWRQITTMAEVLLRPPVASATAALLAILIISLVSVQVMPVSAEEVLHKVALADAHRLATTPRQAIRQRVRIRRVDRRSFNTGTSILESWKADNSSYWDARADQVDSELLDRYRANGIPAFLPLSSASIMAWTHLAASTPIASREYDGAVRIRFVPSASARARGLEDVSFRIEPQDWQVSDLQLSFSDAIFNITQESFGLVDRNQVPRNVLAALDPADPSLRLPPVASAPHPIAHVPVIPNLDELEVSVRYSLHSIGADMGESIEVNRSKAELVVNAWPLPPDRQAELAEVLGSKQGVRLEFQPPEEPAVPKVTVALPDTPPPQKPDQRLTRFFDSAEAEEAYVNGALKERKELLAHLYSLRTLALRWPSDAESHLSPAARNQLSRIVQDHAAGAFLNLIKLEATIRPLLRHFGYDSAMDVAPVDTTCWQDSALDALEKAKATERSLLSLLTTSDQPVSLDEGLPKMHEQLQELDRIVRSLPASGR